MGSFKLQRGGRARRVEGVGEAGRGDVDPEGEREAREEAGVPPGATRAALPLRLTPLYILWRIAT